MTTDRLVMPWFEEAWVIGGPDWRLLWRLADAQGGFFTNAEARSCGVRRSLLSHYARRGVFQRHARGLYRLPWCDPTPLDAIRVAWMAAGRRQAVVSHGSALFLHALILECPSAVHLTLPRTRRGRIRRWKPTDGNRAVRHVPRAALPEEEVTERHGLRVTTAGRSLLDTAHHRAGHEELHEAIARAMTRGLADPVWLLKHARERGGRARWRVEAALAVVAPFRGV